MPSACVIQEHLNGVVTQVETALESVQWGKTFCARVLKEEAALAQEEAVALEEAAALEVSYKRYSLILMGYISHFRQ